MTNVSRRSIAKGAAWSVPAVAVASAAPAMAASSNVTCEKTVQSFSANFAAASWTKLAGTKSADKTTWGDSGATGTTGVGTEWSIQLGNPSSIPAPNGDTTITGVAFYGDKSRKAIVRTVAAKTGAADVATVGITTPVLLTTGLSTSISIQSTVPYNGLCPNAAETLKSISIPIVVTWYRGLTPVAYDANDGCGGTGQLWLNYCYNVPAPGFTGCYTVGPTYTISSSVTKAPAGC